MKRNTYKVFNINTGKLVARNCSYDFAEQLANKVGAGSLVTRKNGSFVMMQEPTNWTDEQLDKFLDSLPKRDERNYKRYLRNKIAWKKQYAKELKKELRKLRKNILEND